MALLAGHRSPYAADLLPSVAATAGATSASALHMEYLQAMESKCTVQTHGHNMRLSNGASLLAEGASLGSLSL